MGNIGSGLGIADQLVKEIVVKSAVDQAGTRALQLMAHAPRAPNLNLQVLVIAFNGFADRLAEIEAALTARYGVRVIPDRQMGGPNCHFLRLQR